MKSQPITQALLREVLHYDRETGAFTWRVQVNNRLKAGDPAGYISDEGYVVIGLFGQDHKAHRLAWLYETGVMPPDRIDHKDTIRHHNRFNNLRLADQSVNAQNVRRARRDNALGVMGVRKQKTSFIARLKVNGERLYLGSFKTAEETHAAYLEAKRAHHPGNTL